jgi:hypothetical protein
MIAVRVGQLPYNSTPKKKMQVFFEIFLKNFYGWSTHGLASQRLVVQIQFPPCYFPQLMV